MEGLQNRETAQGKHTIAFRSVQLPLPLEDISSSPPPREPTPPSPLLQVPSFCFNSAQGPAPKPLLDIEVVRAFLRSKLGSSKPETDHGSSRKVHMGVFGIGTMGFSGSDGGYVHLSSPQANERQGEISSLLFTQEQYGLVQDQTQNGNDQSCVHHGYVRSDVHSWNPYTKHVQNADVQPVYDETGRSTDNDGSYYQRSTPLLDLDEFRYTVSSFLRDTGLQRHPTTSLANKLPWHVPRAAFLARGLEWPPNSFQSEEAKQAYYKRARKRKPFLLGSPPLWTVTAFNLAFFQLLMYNPVARFLDYLIKIP